MTENESGSQPTDPAAAAPPPKPEAPPAKPKPPARELPSQEQIAAWAEGAELPSLENLFNLLNTKLFDAKIMQIKKEELLPQHWQVISRLEPPPDEEFDSLNVAERIRAGAPSSEVGDRRVEAVRVAWRELRGKHPSLWNASDVFAALRRIIDKKRDVAVYDLLCGVRDLWHASDLPQGREQLEVLWACLGFIREKTRK